MKQYLLPALFLLTFYWPMGCMDQDDQRSVSTVSGDIPEERMGTTMLLSESEQYTDLKTGRSFRIHRKADGSYERTDGQALDIYYQPSTRDTFVGSNARLVNSAVVYDKRDGYMIDETRADEAMPNGLVAQSDVQ